MVKKYIGIDIGGTDIKGAIIDQNGLMLTKDKTATQVPLGAEQVVKNIAALTARLLDQAGLRAGDVEGIGIGIPGVVDVDAGVVRYANNLHWDNLPIAAMMRAYYDLPVCVIDDATAAGAGEARFGAGRQYRDMVLLTLGTGLGGAIVLDGRLVGNKRGTGAEIGHTVIEAGGWPCSCGRRGCFECYSSATGLIKKAKEMASSHPESRMWDKLEKRDLANMTAKIPFDCKEEDETASQVVDWYIRYLAEGVTNVANFLRPEVILLGGGVSQAREEHLIVPLREKVAAMIFGGANSPQVHIVKAALGNDAGVYGAAAMLF